MFIKLCQTCGCSYVFLSSFIVRSIVIIALFLGVKILTSAKHLSCNPDSILLPEVGNKSFE